MRSATRVFLLLAPLLFAHDVSAAGLNLRWDACGSQGVNNKSFACNTNTGTNKMAGSFVAPSGVTQLTGMEMTMIGTFNGAGVPSWWQMKNAGTCRQAAISLSTTQDVGWTACTNPWSALSFGSVGSYTVGSPTANNVKISMIAAVFSGGAGPLISGREYYSFTLAVSNVKTVGTGACAGCTTPACLLLQSIKLTQPVGVGDFILTNPVSPNSHAVTWQGESFAACTGTPVQNATWGRIRSMYR